MTFDVASRTLDYVFSEPRLSSETELELDFIGGEPLLEIDLIQDIVDYAIASAKKLKHQWEHNFRIRITTNGLLYSSAKVQAFIKKYHSHLNISISIDGTEKKHDKCRKFRDGKGSYSDVIKSIPLWRKQFPNEGTKMTISHADLPYIYESVRHLISLNIFKIDVNPVLENVWKDGDEAILEAELIKCADYIIDNSLYDIVTLTCFDENLGVPIPEQHQYRYGVCGSFSFAVNFNGDYYTCLRFADFSLREKKGRPIGNISNGVNWNLMRPYQTFCNQITSNHCIKCLIRNGCKCCPAENYDSSLTGTIFEQSQAACKMHRAKVRAKNYYQNKLSYVLSRNDQY